MLQTSPTVIRVLTKHQLLGLLNALRNPTLKLIMKLSLHTVLLRERRYARVQREAADLAHFLAKWGIVLSQGLQRHHFPAGIGPYCNSVSDRVSQHAVYWIILTGIAGQMGKLRSQRRLDPAKANPAIAALGIHPVLKQRVELEIEIKPAAETLDQRDRAGVLPQSLKPGRADDLHR